MDPADAPRRTFPVLERDRLPERRHRRPAPRRRRAGRRAAELDRRGGRGPRARALRAPRRAARRAARRLRRARSAAPPEDVALTTSTSEGVGRVLVGLDLDPGDEILTSDQEHPGLIGPLMAARGRGVARPHRAAARRSPTPSAPGTTARLLLARRLGRRASSRDPRLGELGRPAWSSTAPRASARCRSTCARSAAPPTRAPGQKWLCGADGTGMLYLDAGVRASACACSRPRYLSFADARRGLDSALHDDARRATTRRRSRARRSSLSLAALRRARGVGLGRACTSARREPGRGAGRRARRARARASRRAAATTLVSWEDADPRRRATGSPRPGVVIRYLPGRRSCAPPSARGTTSPTSTACSARSSPSSAGA